MPAKHVKIIYIPEGDNAPETHDVIITAGDQLRTRDWEKKNRPAEEKEPDFVSIMYYAMYLAAKRARLPHSEAEFLEWADHVADYEAEEDEEDPVRTALDKANARLLEAGLDPVVLGMDDDEGEDGATPPQPS